MLCNLIQCQLTQQYNSDVYILTKLYAPSGGIFSYHIHCCNADIVHLVYIKPRVQRQADSMFLAISSRCDSWNEGSVGEGIALSRWYCFNLVEIEAV